MKKSTNPVSEGPKGLSPARELVKPSPIDSFANVVETLCTEYNHPCTCGDTNTNSSPDEDSDILF